jgi:hypothetical protein
MTTKVMTKKMAAKLIAEKLTRQAAVAGWWTADGWADPGSQLQTQLYVNLRPDDLSSAVLGGGNEVLVSASATLAATDVRNRTTKALSPNGPRTRVPARPPKPRPARHARLVVCRSNSVVGCEIRTLVRRWR